MTNHASKETGKEILHLVLTLVLLVVVMFPFGHLKGFSVIRNTVYDLGAQFSPYAYFINPALFILGTGSLAAGWKFFEGFVSARVLLACFGISMVMTAFFNQAPSAPGEFFSQVEDAWNAWFRYSSLLSFMILSFLTAYILISEKQRILARAAGFSVFILSVSLSPSVSYDGLGHRIIFTIIFGWLIYNFRYGEIYP